MVAKVFSLNAVDAGGRLGAVGVGGGISVLPTWRPSSHYPSTEKLLSGLTLRRREKKPRLMVRPARCCAIGLFTSTRVPGT